MAIIDVSYTAENNAAFLPPVRCRRKSVLFLKIIGVPDIPALVDSVAVSITNADGVTEIFAATKFENVYHVAVRSDFIRTAGTIKSGLIVAAKVSLAGVDDFWTLGVGDVEVVANNQSVAPEYSETYDGETATAGDRLADVKEKLNDLILWMKGIAT